MPVEPVETDFDKLSLRKSCVILAMSYVTQYQEALTTVQNQLAQKLERPLQVDELNALANVGSIDQLESLELAIFCEDDPLALELELWERLAHTEHNYRTALGQLKANCADQLNRPLSVDEQTALDHLPTLVEVMTRQERLPTLKELGDVLRWLNTS